MYIYIYYVYVHYIIVILLYIDVNIVYYIRCKRFPCKQVQNLHVRRGPPSKEDVYARVSI